MFLPLQSVFLRSSCELAAQGGREREPRTVCGTRPVLFPGPNHMDGLSAAKSKAWTRHVTALHSELMRAADMSGPSVDGVTSALWGLDFCHSAPLQRPLRSRVPIVQKRIVACRVFRQSIGKV